MIITLHGGAQLRDDYEISVYIEPWLEIPWRRLPDATIEVDDAYQFDVRVAIVDIPSRVPEERRKEYRGCALTGVAFYL
jgi:hypothetical protein